MKDTKIEWAHHTFNPWVGCSKVHPGCANCYAEELMANRFNQVQWGPNGTRRLTSESNWRQPMKWDTAAKNDREAWSEECAERDSLVWPGKPERPRVFCGSLCDWAEDWQGIIQTPGNSDACEMLMDDARFDLLDLAAKCENLDWLFLTKRPERVPATLEQWSANHRKTCPDCGQGTRATHAACVVHCAACQRSGKQHTFGIPPHFWFGTSVSDQETAERLVPELLKIRQVAPHSKLFVSAEPMLGSIDWTRLNNGGGETYDCLRATVTTGRRASKGGRSSVVTFRTSDTDPLDWIVVGGESGPNARQCNVDWIRSTVEQCRSAGVPVFVKQLGSHVVGWHYDRMEMLGETCHATGRDAIVRWRLQDRKGGDPSEWPDDLCVREVP